MDSGGRVLLRDAALWTVLGLGFLYATGYLWTESYYTSLGVPLSDLNLPPYVYLQAAFLPLIAPLALFVGLFTFSSLLPKDSERWARFRMDALGTMAATVALVGWARMSFILTNDGLETEWFRLNTLTAVFLVQLAFVFWLGSNPYARIRLATKERRTGRDAGGVATLLFLTLLFWVIATSFHGSGTADDLKRGCAQHNTVTFEPTPLGLENKTYLHVLHNDGRYYVRDPSSEPNGPTFVVPDSEVASAQLTRWRALC